MASRILFLLFISASLVSCGTKKNASGDTNSNSHNSGNNHGTEHQAIFEDIAKGDSLFASIKKGYCYGRCPVYEMYIYNSGLVVLKGTANIEPLGEHTTRITKAQMLAFIDMANDIKYLEMEDEYDNPGISDLPETTTSIVMGGKRKSVRRRYGYPTAIVAFEDLFAALLTSQEWHPGNARE